MKLLDIADTAVKVGLGACIGGLGAILLASIQHQHELKRILFQRRSDMLERITEDFEEEHNTVIEWYGIQCAAIKARQRNEPFTDVITTAVEKGEKKLREQGTVLHRLEGRLQLLGLGGCALAIADYRTSFVDLHRLSRQQVSDVEFVTKGTKLLAERDRVHEELSKAYRRLM